MRSLRQSLLLAMVSALFFMGLPVAGRKMSPPESNAAHFQLQAQNQTAQRLNLQEAESIAIQNHPRIQAAAELASAAAAQVKEVQSAYYPQANGSLTGVKAETNSAIAAGFLTSSAFTNKFAEGASVSQLVTDFGRTHALSKSSQLHAQSARENIVTTRSDVLLQVNLSYFNALKAQSVLQVAVETVKARQLVVDQVGALAKSNLKSGPGREFCECGFGQGAAPTGASAE